MNVSAIDSLPGCQHLVCRRRQDRQDLQCQRVAGHTGDHLHTVALGWCGRPELPGQDGRTWGHLAAQCRASQLAESRSQYHCDLEVGHPGRHHRNSGDPAARFFD